MENSFGKPRRHELGNVLTLLYGSCESFSLDFDISMSDEKERSKKLCSNITLKTVWRVKV